jgi:hypothetical protein
MELRKRTLSPAEQAKLENAEAQAEINRANIDYIAMMADVEIPTEEVSENAQSEI